jgi:NAD(P)-dependent dehydrogenase (short-subunit alcohol dehydrogenase family)
VSVTEPRTALVTGASRGIGRAIALALAGDGYDVAVTARTETEGTGQFGLPGSLERTVADIEATGRRALAVPLDLLDRDELVPAVDRVLDAFGHLDVLVNNAIYVSDGGLAPFIDTDPVDLERRIFADLTAQLLLSQPVLRAMAARGSGTIINVTAGGGRARPTKKPGEGGWGLVYSCAKGGFHRMTAQIAVELGDRGIRCYDLEPGMVNTERVLAGGEALAFVAKFGKPPSAVGAAAAWLLRQPDGSVPNGSVVDTQVVGEQLGLVKDGVWTSP